MKTLRKIRKNAKALSPVVASIILIAVTVAVSIAVAAWMGALTVGFMNTEQVKVTNCHFVTGGAINCTITNSGTSDVTISEIWVNNEQQSTGIVWSGAAGIVPKNTAITVQFSYTWASGSSYSIQFKSTQGNTFPYTASAPS
jgi:flagellin-like protein